MMKESVKKRVGHGGVSSCALVLSTEMHARAVMNVRGY
jgi:hypothetical protein